MKRVAGIHRTIPLWQKLHLETAKSPYFPYILFTSRRDTSEKHKRSVVLLFFPYDLGSRKLKARAEAVARRATNAAVLEDAERLIGDWNERQARRMPLIFARTVSAGLLVYAGSMSGLPVDPRMRDRDAVVTTLIPAPPYRRRVLGH